MASLFSTTKLPEPPKQVVMPLASDEKARKRRKQSVKEQQERGGRISTILSDKLGG